MKNILLNNQQYHFSLNQLPIFIHGSATTGSSLFTISLVADLYRQGNKILFTSGYHMARDEFISQTEGKAETVLIEDITQIDTNTDAEVIFVKRETPEAFMKLINRLKDIDERIILIKNFELFDKEVFESIKDKHSFILSGDIDNCAYKEEVLKTKFITEILFSQPTVDIGKILPRLEKYQGYMWGNEDTGVTRLSF